MLYSILYFSIKNIEECGRVRGVVFGLWVGPGFSPQPGPAHCVIFSSVPLASTTLQPTPHHHQHLKVRSGLQTGDGVGPAPILR